MILLDEQREIGPIEVLSDDGKDTVVFVTNNLTLAATTIADIYRERWQIELFFKAIKQSLKIRTFVGTSENAVKVQRWLDDPFESPPVPVAIDGGQRALPWA